MAVPRHCRPTYELPIAPWARPDDGCTYGGYYVGGGCPFKGEPRYALEGTWGWDYFGCWFQRRVNLAWCLCRYQDGTGAYRSEPPAGNSLPHLVAPNR
jgi:hypothetical protein